MPDTPATPEPQDRPAREPFVPSSAYSPLLVRAFTRYARHYVRRHFHAVRLLEGAAPAAPGDRPLVVYLNHPGWWDPLTALVAATAFFPERRHFAPIDAKALEKYRFFRRLGFFGVEPDSPRGGVTFLRTSRAILRHPDAALWVTAQGGFTDPRTRPVTLRPGVAHLARRVPDALFLPLAIEYPFWQERTPEALLAFGDPVDPRSHPAQSADAWNRLLESRLEAAMTRLADAAQTRDPSAFTPLLRGRAGVGGAYDLYKRLRARLRGERFDPSHSGEDGPA